jgi:putative transposon-encoded protein
MVVYMVKKIKIASGKIEFQDEYEIMFEKIITKFGSGAKIDAPKEFLGKKVYVLVRKE